MKPATVLRWFWPTVLILVLLILSTVVPGGAESVVYLGLIGLQVLVVIYQVVRWVVAEANARSAQS